MSKEKIESFINEIIDLVFNEVKQDNDYYIFLEDQVFETYFAFYYVNKEKFNKIFRKHFDNISNVNVNLYIPFHMNIKGYENLYTSEKINIFEKMYDNNLESIFTDVLDILNSSSTKNKLEEFNDFKDVIVDFNITVSFEFYFKKRIKVEQMIVDSIEMIFSKKYKAQHLF